MSQRSPNVAVMSQPAPELIGIVGGSLSPSRAADFMSCPLKYRFRVIDRLEEAPSPVATRGTLVHAVLERLFDLPAAERTVDTAVAMVQPEWDKLFEQEPELVSLFEGEDAVDLTEWLASARALVETYFEMEDPSRLEPAAREIRLSHVLEGVQIKGVAGDGGSASDGGDDSDGDEHRSSSESLLESVELRGIIDRLDASPSGALRVVDYKTGRAPGEGFESSALFQMKFYALLLLRSRGVVPKELKLMYLSGKEALTYHPDERELDLFERRVTAIWQAIRRAELTGDWRPKKSKLCSWCDHRALCPEFGGTPPDLPVRGESAS